MDVLKERSRQCSLPGTPGKSDQADMTSITLKAGAPVLRWCLWAWVLLLCSACALLPQPRIDPPSVALPDPGLSASLPGVSYQIVRAQLELHTFRDGWLSHLAHNHVMQTDAISGAIQLTDPIENSTARLYFRPWDLVLDDPAAREAAGTGFESERTDADIAATRRRMLGPKGFDSNAHPLVTVEVSWLDASQVSLVIQLRGERYRFPAAVTWSRTERGIEARSDLQLSHRELGMKPYSAFAGAIAVADPIRIRLQLSAERARPL